MLAGIRGPILREDPPGCFEFRKLLGAGIGRHNAPERSRQTHLRRPFGGALEIEDIFMVQPADKSRMNIDSLVVNALDHLLVQLRLAQQELTEAQDRFRAGVAGNADVITAALKVNDSRTNVVNALTSYQSARVSLASAQGSVTTLP